MQVEEKTHVFELLPNGKQHVSFSEVREWESCSWKHKLHQVLKIDLGKPGPLMDFGTAVHASCENYLRTKVMDPSISETLIRESWSKNKEVPGFEEKHLEKFVAESAAILEEVPGWMDSTFPGWECIDAEHQLYEPINQQPHAFKGFIDGVIKIPGKSKSSPFVYWLLDWKTTSWGWNFQKKNDPSVKAQLVLYKNFWSKKLNIDPKHVKCAFVLLKRTAKIGSKCEMITVSVGDVTTQKSLKLLNNMVVSMKRGVAIKNRSSCQYCEYANTEHCT